MVYQLITDNSGKDKTKKVLVGPSSGDKHWISKFQKTLKASPCRGRHFQVDELFHTFDEIGHGVDHRGDESNIGHRVSM